AKPRQGRKQSDMYTVSSLTDYSATALDAASRDLLSALESESVAVNGENDYKLFRDRWLARKDGIATQINDLWLKAAPKEAKRDAGQLVNELKLAISQRVESLRPKQVFSFSSTGGVTVSGSVSADITLPGVRRHLGVEHPVIHTM